MRGMTSAVTVLALFGLAGVTACGGHTARPPEALSYPVTSALYVQGVAIAPNVPAVTNPVSSWTVAPPLPVGLALDPANGTISGTPTSAQPETFYDVTAANPDGSISVQLAIAVKPAGHLSAKLVHFHDSAGWGAVNLAYRPDDGAWVTAPGVAMTSQGGGWFTATIPACRSAEFSFNDGATSLPSQAAGGLRTSWEEVWVKGGVIFTYDPDAGTRPADELVILTLNLHTYQELHVADGGTQAAKLDRVADLIATVDADLVLLEECAQTATAAVIADPRAHLSAGSTEAIKADNMAYLISKRLAEVHGLTRPYAWSWAHYGFTSYEEGVAILTRQPIDAYADTYVSTSTSQGDPLGARKAIYASVTLPSGKVVNAFAAHLSFAGAEQDRQLDTLRGWMAGKAGNGAAASIVGGDFNMEAGGAGWLRMTSSTGGDPYLDAYWLANPEGFSDATIGSGQRIDYVFSASRDGLIPVTGQRYFVIGEPFLGGRVSDHNGTLVRLRLPP